MNKLIITFVAATLTMGAAFAQTPTAAPVGATVAASGTAAVSGAKASATTAVTNAKATAASKVAAVKGAPAAGMSKVKGAVAASMPAAT